MEDLPIPPPSAEEASAALELAKNMASCNLPLLLERAVERAFDPSANFRQVMDAAEFTYKVSGMASKQADKPSGPGFSIVINLPTDVPGVPKEIVIGSGAAVEEDLFPKAPAWLSGATMESDL